MFAPVMRTVCVCSCRVDTVEAAMMPALGGLISKLFEMSLVARLLPSRRMQKDIYICVCIHIQRHPTHALSSHISISEVFLIPISEVKKRKKVTWRRQRHKVRPRVDDSGFELSNSPRSTFLIVLSSSTRYFSDNLLV